MFVALVVTLEYDKDTDDPQKKTLLRSLSEFRAAHFALMKGLYMHFSGSS